MKNNKTTWDIVQNARSLKKSNYKDFIDNIFDHGFTLKGDRLFGDDLAFRTGIACINGKPFTVIANVKEKDVNDNFASNFGMSHPEGYRKALRLIKQAEKFNRPVICFIDTPGAYPGITSEDRGIAEAIARNLLELSTVSIPIITIIMGEAGSGGAIALACGDEVWAMEDSYYSVISPEGCASILLKDASRAAEAAERLKIIPTDLLELEIIDQIIPEKHKFKYLKKELLAKVEELEKLSTEELLNKRYERFRKFGQYEGKHE